MYTLIHSLPTIREHDSEEESEYFNPQTNIDTVNDILRREAKSGSNVYLHLDSAHGRLDKMTMNPSTKLNLKLHLILTPARGSPEYGLREKDEKVEMLSIMKNFLESARENFDDLFTREGCMTFKGSLFLYCISLIHEYSWSQLVYIGLMETLQTLYEGTSDTEPLFALALTLPRLPPPSPDLEEPEPGPDPEEPEPGIKLSLFLKAIKRHFPIKIMKRLYLEF